MRVLLVDDEVELITALAERLSIRGIEAVCATTGEQALDLVRAEEHDIVILDVKMPGLSGLDLLRALREVRPALKCIFVTGHGSEGDYEASSRMGSCETIIKPIKIEKLLAQIERATSASEQE